MTRFLLTAVNAKYIHSNPAIYSLRGYAGERYLPYIQLAEYTINHRMQDILADIYQKKPNAIGFSCYIWNWTMIRELIAELPKVLPDTDIWLGGPEVSYDAPEILKTFPQVTGIMIGEGEATFLELMEYYVEGNKDLSQIPGLCLREGYTPYRELTSMDALPFLYEDLEPFTNKIIYYETSRGCPYRCSYCLSAIDKKVRLRDIGVVKRELQFFLDHKVSQVKFVDRTFNCDHNHAMAIWTYIKEHDNGVTNFHFEISADILRDEEIRLLNTLRPGLVQLEIGVQSTNPETIHAIDRVMNVERLEQIVASIRAGRNIHQHLDLIAGLPYEDYESFGRSFDRVYGMKPDQLQLGFLKVLKGSPMEERASEYGVKYLANPPYEVLCSNWLSYEEVLRLKGIEEMVELYYNSAQFVHTIAFLEGAFISPFAMYEAMADFYREKGYLISQPARAYRYQVLLEFALLHDSARAAVYKELLTYDLYLRENVKSRPDFAGDITEEQKEFVRNFYRTEEETRAYLPDYGQYDWKQLSKMTHLEAFVYPVWDADQMRRLRVSSDVIASETGALDAVISRAEEAEEVNCVNYVLFDYQNRNPLSYEARTVLVGEESPK